MADKGEAWQNGYAERLIRTIKEEEVDLSEHLGCHDACRQIGRFLDDVYIHKRIHSSLGYLTSAEFEAQWRQEHTLVLDLEPTAVCGVCSLWGSLHI
jgi:transposase InsO family protein